MKYKISPYTIAILGIIASMGSLVFPYLIKTEKFDLWLGRLDVFILTNACIGGIASIILLVMLEFRKNRPIKYVTDYILKRKFVELSFSLTILSTMFGMAVFFQDRDIVRLSIIISACIIATYSLTIFRVWRGLFGFNAFEMREIISYIETSQKGDLPPGIGGLREPKLNDKKMNYLVKAGSEI